ncbi:MAG: ABC transporter ATP-binding protein [Actinobacteria bacterium]|nr:ABC transporter ATP-binding protein [Actinomycetota bacterium]
MSATRPSPPVTAQIRLPDQSAVRFSGVSVRHGSAAVIDDVDLAIERNICFGIAANAPTTLRAVADLIATARRPSAGTVTVLGFDAATETAEIRSRLGYLPHPHPVPSHLRVAEYLSLQAAALGVPKANWESTIDTLLTLAGIAGRQDAFTDQLSSGARQLLGVAGALVNDPGVVVLHEPTWGLDGRARSRLWNMLHRLTEVSRTIIVCSRQLSELSAGCARIAVFDEARIIDEGPPTDVLGRLGGARRIRARLANGVVRTHTVADVAAQAALLKKLVAADLELIEFAEVAPELDDLHLATSHTPSATRGPGR